MIALISIAGIASGPFLCFVESIIKEAKRPDIPVEGATFFSETHLYVFLLIGVLLFSVVTAYLFNREYTEHTLKNILTIPVSRIQFILSKLILLCLWTMALTLFAWLITVLFALLGQFDGLSMQLFLDAFKQFMMSGFALFLLSTPMILVTLLFKNYVVTIVFAIAITMLNLLTYGSEYSALLPWTAVRVIATGTFFPEYPPIYSYISIIMTFCVGLIASILYFKNTDVN